MAPPGRSLPANKRNQNLEDAILILNAGSSSLKFAVVQGGDGAKVVVRGQVEGLGSTPKFRARDANGRIIGEKAWGRGTDVDHSGAIEFLLSWIGDHQTREHRLIAAGHRVVHGGLEFDRPVRIDESVLAKLRTLVPLAPLHQPHNLAAIEAVTRLKPVMPQVACFDTAFHRTQPSLAQVFAIPHEYTDAGIRRYGFHGLSIEYISGMLFGVDPVAASGRTIVAHLGNGASMCAMLGGRSVATTMGFTAMEGLVMGTRCGSIDPGVLLYLQEHSGLSVEEVREMLYERSGLLGISGISSDMRTLLESKEPRAKAAVELFVYRAAREIGSLAAAIGGLDALVFTGGIGENAAAVRSGICAASRWLGLEPDDDANLKHGPRITRVDSRVSAWVIPTNEELMIARHTAAVLQVGSS